MTIATYPALHVTIEGHAGLVEEIDRAFYASFQDGDLDPRRFGTLYWYGNGEEYGLE